MVEYINLKNLILTDMMLPENNIKEGLSCSYLKAVANIAGYPVEFKSADFGIDAIITELIARDTGRTFESGNNLWIQIKSTVLRNIRETDTEIVYNLANKNYNDLTYSTIYTPRILVLFVMPNDKEEWLTHSMESLMLKKCAYWTYLSNKPVAGREDSTTAVTINKTNTFSPDTLKAIMEKINLRGDLYDLL